MRFAFFALFLAVTATPFFSETVSETGKVLLVYDGMKGKPSPFVERFRQAFIEAGLAFEEAAAENLGSADLSGYRCVVIHGMVMAFNGISPVRDWLEGKPNLQGVNVRVFVTASRWFNEDLARELSDLASKDGAEVVDAISAATKRLSEAEKGELVRKQIDALK
jgi:hypothetical protein